MKISFKEDKIKLKKLVKRWTKADIMARVGESKGMNFGDYAVKALDLEDEIRTYLFKTSNLVELGHKWGLPLAIDRKKKK